MSAPWYEPLSALDRSFLALESRTTHMHVGAVATFEAASLRRSDGGVDIERIRRFVDSKLHLIPRYRQRLAWLPLEQVPVWVDDEHLNLAYHVRHISLPRPGTDGQLEELAGRLMSQQLDRAKPLWELWVVEGLDGDRFALVTKVHHCMIDGVAGVDLMAMLLDVAPTAEITEPPPWLPRPVPGGTELFIRETSRLVSEALATLRDLPGLAGDAVGVLGEAARRLRAMGASLTSGWLLPADRTPLNGSIGPNRRFDRLDLPLAAVKTVKDALGGTVNDVVLATVAGGVRRFLIERRGRSEADLAGLDFRVMAPVSVRSRRGTMGNEVAMWLVRLPVGVPDPSARLQAVAAATRRLKETEQALGAATLARLSAGAPGTLVSLGARLAAQARPFNMTVTNVPGPQFPLYLLGARLLATYPLVPLWDGHGVGVALFSYDGTLHWGFNADWDLMEDLADFVAEVEAGFEELRAAAEGVAATSDG